ncbi:MAG: hypothetical protein GXO74_16720 [Calditrichaeota bacterium]|nr:hypothetical protein [Calditrichota bacterium]
MKKSFMLLAAFVLIFSLNLLAQGLLEKADEFWDKRGDNFNADKLLADSAQINQAISLYQQILAKAVGQEKEEATWKLIRAYYFKGKYCTADKDMKKKIYNLGKDLGEASLKEFPNSAGITLFTAIVWGVWGEEYGILAAARKGVAGKIKDLCEKSIEVDPNFDGAGGYRVLGRVYFKAPKIWPFLRWPSKTKAVEILEKGHKLAADNLTTKQFLAEALYSQGKKKRAVALMNEILNASGVHEGVAEDAVLKDEVRGTLQEWEK